MKTERQIKTIGPDEHFYGYIIGLQIEQNWEVKLGASELYALFEYNGETTIWIVPDYELFEILSKFLLLMAYERKESDAYGMQKLWISKVGHQWIVDLP
jgi:hypothetical protein